MKKQLCLVAMAGLLVSSYAGAATFSNGGSYFGSQVPTSQYARVIDLAKGGPVNIVCGETVTFMNNGQQFTWKFDSIRHSKVALNQFAPSGFDTGNKVVYINRGDHEITS